MSERYRESAVLIVVPTACTSNRPVMYASCVGFKTTVSAPSSGTVHNWCWSRLAGPFLIGMQKISQEIHYVLLPSTRLVKLDLARESSWVSPQTLFCFPVSGPIRVSLKTNYYGIFFLLFNVSGIFRDLRTPKIRKNSYEQKII